MEKVYGLCLQGDICGAYHFLKELPIKTEETKSFQKKLKERFFSGKREFDVKSQDPWVIDIVNAYNRYFVHVLTQKMEKEDAEKLLVKELNILVQDPNTNLDKIEQILENQFNEKGFYFLGGVTAPFRGPYIWSKMDKGTYSVELPESVEQVDVYYMSDFIMKSWLYFATFGEKGAGGWAKTNALYCVYESYKNSLDKPHFQISYLKHEAQHFSDFKRFPSINSIDLEYRAKLVELIYYPTNELILKFLSSAKSDPNFPHEYASYKIISELSEGIFKKAFEGDALVWEGADQSIIACQAKELYYKHTKELTQKKEIAL